MFSLAIATAHADIYKWVDDQGKVHYSDAPPRGAASQKIEIPTAPPQGENAQEQLKAFLEEQKKQEEAHKEERVRKQEAQVVKQREGERLNRCLAAQDQLDLMQFERPVFRMDEKGERVYLEDKDRPAETERLKKEIAICRASKDDERKFQAAREERFWRDACGFFEEILKEAEDPQFVGTIAASRIVNLKEVKKSYCDATWRGRGERVHSKTVKQNACKDLQDLSEYLRSQGTVSADALSFSTMVEAHCGQ
jgi:hypothetical protein